MNPARIDHAHDRRRELKANSRPAMENSFTGPGRRPDVGRTTSEIFEGQHDLLAAGF
jgi:hypothetical protein